MQKSVGLLCLLFLISSAFTGSSSKIIFAFNDVINLPYLDLPYISAVINDPSDPAGTRGISLLIDDENASVPASGYILSAKSSNTSVVDNSNIKLIKNNGSATAFITPSGVGYSDITFLVTYKKSTKTLIVHYAASAASSDKTSTWHTGGSDASAAVPIGNDYMLVADDELDRLFLFSRHQSGLPLSSFYYADKLGLTDGSAPFYKEVDVEAGVASPRIPGRTYWIGSMSNSSSFKYKPNRNHLFAVDIKDTGSHATCSFAGYTDNLRQQLIKWGNDNNYKFGKSAATGKNPKADDGFNIEAMAFAPDSTTLYLGFRAPLVPLSDRKKVVIAPIEHFEQWFNGGKTKSKPIIGSPVELDLGGRSLRDMIRLSSGLYIIVAGSSGEKHEGAVYKWSGNPMDSAILVPGFNIINLNAEAVLEVDNEQGKLIPDKLQVLSDNGTMIYYNDNRPAKELQQTNFRKFRSDIISCPEPAIISN